MFTKNGPIVSYKIDRNRKTPSDILINYGSEATLLVGIIFLFPFLLLIKYLGIKCVSQKAGYLFSFCG